VVPPCFDSQTAQPVVGPTILYPALTGWPGTSYHCMAMQFRAIDSRATFKALIRRRLAPGDLHSLADSFPLLRSFQVFYTILPQTIHAERIICQAKNQPDRPKICASTNFNLPAWW